MKETLKNILLIVTLLIMISTVLINSNEIVTSFIDYSIIFLTKIFPTTFTFYILSSLLIELGLIELINKYFHINSSTIYVFALSMISGFPSGSKYTKDLLNKNLITKEEANKLVMFTHFPNPLFVLVSTNTIIKNSTISFKILISIIISNLILLIIFKSKNKNNLELNNINTSSFSNLLSNTIISTFNTLLIIYGTSIFFFLLAETITEYFYLNTYLYILLNGLLDLTKGVFSTSLISNNLIRSLFIIFFISFGGISIHMQVKSIITNTKIKYLNFLKGRILGTIISLIIFYILYTYI